MSQTIDLYVGNDFLLYYTISIKKLKKKVCSGEQKEDNEGYISQYGRILKYINNMYSLWNPFSGHFIFFARDKTSHQGLFINTGGAY